MVKPEDSDGTWLKNGLFKGVGDACSAEPPAHGIQQGDASAGDSPDRISWLWKNNAPELYFEQESRKEDCRDRKRSRTNLSHRNFFPAFHISNGTRLYSYFNVQEIQFMRVLNVNPHILIPRITSNRVRRSGRRWRPHQKGQQGERALRGGVSATSQTPAPALFRACTASIPINSMAQCLLCAAYMAGRACVRPAGWARDRQQLRAHPAARTCTAAQARHRQQLRSAFMLLARMRLPPRQLLLRWPPRI